MDNIIDYTENSTRILQADVSNNLLDNSSTKRKSNFVKWFLIILGIFILINLIILYIF